jgi:hypothetical protein
MLRWPSDRDLLLRVATELEGHGAAVCPDSSGGPNQVSQPQGTVRRDSGGGGTGPGPVPGPTASPPRRTCCGPPWRRCVDLGCGTGLMAPLIAPYMAALAPEAGAAAGSMGILLEGAAPTHHL